MSITPDERKANEARRAAGSTRNVIGGWKTFLDDDAGRSARLYVGTAYTSLYVSDVFVGYLVEIITFSPATTECEDVLCGAAAWASQILRICTSGPTDSTLADRRSRARATHVIDIIPNFGFDLTHADLSVASGRHAGGHRYCGAVEILDTYYEPGGPLRSMCLKILLFSGPVRFLLHVGSLQVVSLRPPTTWEVTMNIRLLTGFLLTLCMASANAVVVSVNDWTYIDNVDTGTTLFRVTETFTSAAELGGTENLYEYEVENLSDYTASLFRVANPTGLSRTMNGPTDWDERSGAPNFVWETFDSTYYLDPGDTLGGFQIYTPGLIPELTFDAFGYNGAGWIMATDEAGSRIDIHGELTRSVPEPVSLLLLAIGLFGVGVSTRRHGGA